MSGYIGPIPVPQGIQNKETFTATAGQTTFNTNGYTDGAFISVYLNGVRLINGTDYTATNGSDVVLTSAAAASDVVDFESFNSFSLASQQFENITTKNPTHEDTDGGRESAISFKGEQSGGEISTLAQIQASHDGTSDDQKGDLIFKTNDGSDNDAPTERLRIDSNGSILTATLGTSNVHLGDGAGASIASGGNYNVALGHSAFTTNTTGDENVAVGAFSGGLVTTGSDNVFVGVGAGRQQTTASSNTAVGYQAGYSTTTGSYQTHLGFSAGRSNTTGNLLAVGYEAGYSATTGTANTFVGRYRAGYSTTTGSKNTGVGDQILYSNTTGGNNVAIGYAAMYSSTTASNNTAVGYQSLYANTTGASNTALGYKALDANTTGGQIVSLGHGTLGNNTTGGSLVAVGQGSMSSNTTGSYNVAIGRDSLAANTTASNNTAVGYQAGLANTTGDANTFLGRKAGFTQTTGRFNTFIGDEAGGSVTTGISNTFVGNDSGFSMTTGSENTIIGAFNGNQNGLDIRTSSNNIVLSDGDGNPRVHHDGTVFKVLGNSQNNTICSIINASSANPYGLSFSFTGAAPNNTTEYFLNCADTGGVRLQIKSNGNVVNVNNSYGAYSDQKLKENIVDSGSQWEDIKAVRVRKYSLKADELDAPNKLGVIAQELEASNMNGLVSTEPDLDPDTKEDLGTETKSVQYSVLYMKAVKALQEAMARIETLESENTAIKARLDALEAE